MSVTVIKPKDRGEWLEHRKYGIGSSEIASILGLNPYQTPYQLWRRKKGMEGQQQETFAMKAGHYLEDAVSLFWADETGREVIKSSAGDWLFVNDTREFLRVSPDRTFWLPGMARNNQNKGILECKTTQMNIDPDNLPKHWFCQLQYLLGVSEMQQGSLAWLCSGREFGYRDIAYVPDFYGWMVEEAEKFWQDYILGDKEPPAINVTDVITKYAHHTDGKIAEVTPELYQRYLKLKEVRAELRVLEATKDDLEAELKLRMEDAEEMSYEGKTLVTWKAAKDSTRFDSKAFCADNPELAQQYTTTQPGARRFLVK